jgi:hypothetical protein
MLGILGNILIGLSTNLASSFLYNKQFQIEEKLDKITKNWESTLHENEKPPFSLL